MGKYTVEETVSSDRLYANYTIVDGTTKKGHTVYLCTMCDVQATGKSPLLRHWDSHKHQSELGSTGTSVIPKAPEGPIFHQPPNPVVPKAPEGPAPVFRQLRNPLPNPKAPAVEKRVEGPRGRGEKVCLKCFSVHDGPCLKGRKVE